MDGDLLKERNVLEEANCLSATKAIELIICALTQKNNKLFCRDYKNNNILWFENNNVSIYVQKFFLSYCISLDKLDCKHNIKRTIFNRCLFKFGKYRHLLRQLNPIIINKSLINNKRHEMIRKEVEREFLNGVVNN